MQVSTEILMQLLLNHTAILVLWQNEMILLLKVCNHQKTLELFERLILLAFLNITVTCWNRRDYCLF